MIIIEREIIEWNVFSFLYDIIGECIPKKIISNKYARPYWLDNKLYRLSREKNLAHRHYKKTLSGRARVEFSSLRAECERLQKQNDKNYINNIESNIKKGVKSF